MSNVGCRDYKGTDLFHLVFDVKATFEVNSPLTAELIEKMEEAIYEAINNVNSWGENERYCNLLIDVDIPAIRYNPRLVVEAEEEANDL